MTTSTLHIVFSSLAAGSLTQALRDNGRKDRVAAHFDNLALGPINPPDPHMRLDWMEQELRGTDSTGAWTHTDDDSFWNAALVEDVCCVAWI